MRFKAKQIINSKTAEYFAKLTKRELIQIRGEFINGYIDGLLGERIDPEPFLDKSDKINYLTGFEFGKKEYEKNKKIGLEKELRYEFESGRNDGYKCWNPKKKSLAYLLGFNIVRETRDKISNFFRQE